MLIHTYDHHLSIASLWPISRAIFLFVQLASFNPLAWTLLKSYICIIHLGIITVSVRYLQSKWHRKFDHQIENHSWYTPAKSTVPLSWSFHYSFTGHQNLIICIFGDNVFAYEISLQSNSSFLERRFFVIDSISETQKGRAPR